MLNLLFSDFPAFIVALIGLVISLTIHEFAHAFVADKLGDPTPRLQGRVTLNPLAHLDPLGTLAILLVGIGWGKPVQFDPHNLKNPLRDTALIALAGPASNIILAFLIAQVFKLPIAETQWIANTLGAIFMVNLGLAIFNLVPVYPLDGSKILLAFLPRHLAFEYDDFMRRYGQFVLLALILPWFNGMSPVQFLVVPAMKFVGSLILSV